MNERTDEKPKLECRNPKRDQSRQLIFSRPFKASGMIYAKDFKRDVRETRVTRRGFVGSLLAGGALAATGSHNYGFGADGASPAEHPASSVAVDANTWPMFRGDPQSRGVAVSELPDELDLLWKYRVENGAFEGTAAIANDVAYIGDLDGSLFALELETGKLLWQSKQSELGFGTSPAVRGDRLYLGDYDGVFYCLGTDKGEVKWKFTAEAEINSGANFYQDKVLFGSQDASLYCLNAETGELAWKYTIDDQIRCMPSLIDNRAFVAGCDARLHVIDVEKGKAAGNVEIDGPTGVTPAADVDFVYFGTESGTFYAINWRKAEVAWRFQDNSSSLAFRSSAAVSGRHVVVGGRSKRVYAFDAETGDTRWEFVTRRNVDSSPVIAGQRVYVGSGDGRLYCLELETGKKVWEYETGGRLYAAPAIAAGKLIIASDDGVVYCFGENKLNE
jgi:outer membrane protein assembly factor BamB